jgi:RNA polymerase sigma factor (sigma-70 family)
MTYQDSLDFYRSIAKAYPILTREEELKLLKRVRKGDKQARELLVKHNLNLVIHLCKKHDGKGVPFEDLVQEGMAGFVHAIDMFDTNQKVKLSTYAVWWVNANIFKYLKLNRAPVKMPHIRKGEAPIAVPRGVSMSTPIGENEDNELLDLFADESPLADETYERTEHASDVMEVVRKFTACGAIGKDIVEHRLLADDPKTLQEIAEKHGRSRERIRQLEIVVKDKLKKHLMDYAA